MTAAIFITALKTKNNSSVEKYENIIITAFIKKGFCITPSTKNSFSLFENNDCSFLMSFNLNGFNDLSEYGKPFAKQIQNFLIEIYNKNNLKIFSTIVIDINYMVDISWAGSNFSLP